MSQRLQRKRMKRFGMNKVGLAGCLLKLSDNLLSFKINCIFGQICCGYLTNTNLFYMKKLSLILVSCAVLFACNKPEEKGTPLTPEEQKTKIEDTAIELMDACDAADFKEFVDLGKYISDTYFSNEDYDYTAVITKFMDWYGLFYTEGVSNDKLVIVLSQVTGEFNFGPTKVTYREADNLKLKIKDEQNRECVLDLVTSGSETAVTYIKDGNELTVKVPQNIKLTLKRDAETLATFSFVFDLKLSDQINPSKDRIGVKSTLNVKAYSLQANILYDGANNQISSDGTLSKNGKMLISENLDGVVKLTGDDIENVGFENASGNISLDFLGSVQVKGAISDFLKLYTVLNIYDDNSEASATEAAAKVNSLVSLSLYYDRTTTKQAHIEFECVKDYEYYEVMPVIVFNDGSRYLFDEYFNEENFSRLVSRFEEFIQSYQELLGN